jgi:APA family basic amino acid/polyamine antiporter
MTTPSSSHSPPQLLRVLGLVFGLAVVVGGVIGSGIMRAPGEVAKAITDPMLILVAWALGGCFAMLSAMPLVEAGASVPLAGGTYSISARAFGPGTGFLNGWLTWLQYTASNAFISVVFGEYVHRLHLAEAVPVGVLACGLIIAMTVLNWIGTKVSGTSQSLGSAIKGGAFILLVAILFLAPHGAAPAAKAVAEGAKSLGPITSIGALVTAISVIYSTYAGWDGAIYFSEEVDNPQRNVARATFWGIGLVTIIYVLVNAAAMNVLPPSALAGSNFAVGDAAGVVMGPAAQIFVTAMGLFSLMAIVNLQVMAASRVPFAMARDGVAPRFLLQVAKGGTPRTSLALVSLVSLGIVIVSMIVAPDTGYKWIVRIYSPWSIGAIFMVCISSIKLRVSEPNLERPYRMPLFPFIAILASLVQFALIATLVLDDPIAGAWSGLIGLIIPVAVYLGFRKLWKSDAAA